MFFQIANWRLQLVFLLLTVLSIFQFMNIIVKNAPAKCFRRIVMYVLPVPFSIYFVLSKTYIKKDYIFYILTAVVVFLIAFLIGRMKLAFAMFISIFYIFQICVSKYATLAVYAMFKNQGMYRLLQGSMTCILENIFASAMTSVLMYIYIQFFNRHTLREFSLNMKQLTSIAIFHGFLLVFMYFCAYGTRNDISGFWIPFSLLITTICIQTVYLAILYYGFNMAKMLQYDLHSKAMERQLFSQHAVYEAKKAIITESDTFKHEYRELMLSLEHFLKNGNTEDALKELQTTGPKLLEYLPSLKRYSNNAAIDSLFFELAQRCKENNIEFEGMVYIPEKIDIPDDKLQQIFAILTENALEACMEIRQACNRFIKIHSAKNNNWINIQIENPFSTSLVWKGEKLVSNKKGEHENSGSLEYLKELLDELGCMMQINVDQSHKIFSVTLSVH